MYNQICFPLFNPFTDQGASTARLSEMMLEDKRFVSCSLEFANSEKHITFYAHHADPSWLDVKQVLQPSWELYDERPFPLHSMWVGAAVTIEMVSEITFLPVIGLSGTIDCIVHRNGRFAEYVVKLDSPITQFPLVALPSLSCHPVCLKLRSLEDGAPESQAFYLWLATLIRTALHPIEDDRIWVKVFRDWVEAEDGRLLRRIYGMGGLSGEYVGATINTIESIKNPATIAMMREELGL